MIESSFYRYQIRAQRISLLGRLFDFLSAGYSWGLNPQVYNAHKAGEWNTIFNYPKGSFSKGRNIVFAEMP